MAHQHHYTATTTWTGNTGQGTADYKAYNRNHEISVAGKDIIKGSSDPKFRGDKTRYNPEDLLVSSLSACHMLWYLHQCAVNGIVVTEYADEAMGTMEENADGSGQFTEIVLRPRVTITDASQITKANALHEAAHKLCFIARSVNFPVRIEPHAVARPLQG